MTGDRVGDHDTSVLIVSSSVTARASDESLALIVEELRRRPGVRVERWYLRTDPHGPPPPTGSRVVDSLRTWLPARLLSAVGLERPAGLLRGLRLRWWLRQLRPGVALLDDGLGERLLRGAASQIPRVVRRNPEPPEELHLELGAPARADWLLATSPASLTADDRRIPADRRILEPPAIVLRRVHHGRTRDEADQARRRIGIPPGTPAIVGWGDDGWLDGPEIFVRSLWAVDQHGRTDARGVWLGVDPDSAEGTRLREEAHRCGVADRFHLIASTDEDLRACGDAVLLPYRGSRPGLDDEIAIAVLSGAAVVAFPITELADPAVVVVPALDVARAGEALAEALSGSREDRRVAAMARWLGRVDDMATPLLDLAAGRPR